MGEAFYGLIGAAITAIIAFVTVRATRPKISAEVRSLDWGRFEREIDRLDRKIAAQEVEIAALKADRDARAVVSETRETENRALRAKVTRLERRLGAIEALFKIHAIPPAMQADLDKLNGEG